MDVPGNLSFQTISFSYAAKPDKPLSDFAARFYFLVKKLRPGPNELRVPKYYLTPSNEFLNMRQSLICLHYLLFTSNLTVCKSYNLEHFSFYCTC